MAETPSSMIPLGTTAPEFLLLNVITEKRESLKELKGEKATLIMFICNHCPFVKHVNNELVKIAEEYQPKGVSFVAINSNDVENYPEDSPKKMIEYAQNLGYSFPYLFDETQQTARAYKATCTPDFFLFNNNLKCVYRGQLDDSRPSNKLPVTGKDLRRAIDALLEGKAIEENQLPSIGCNIKYKD